MNIPVLKGRGFTERNGRDAPGVVVINKALAEATSRAKTHSAKSSS